MAPGADPAFQQAMDKLMLQVDADNVLAVHRAFRQHADDLLGYLQQTQSTLTFAPCGLDPVSKATLSADSFVGKIDKLFQVHWNHWRELDSVASKLREVAQSYGLTEDQIARAMRSTTR